MPIKRNTFIEGMDQDSSKSKYKDTRYFKGTNIKVLTEEGLSSGAIENEDGNRTSFTLPNTFGIYKLRYDDAESPAAGYLEISYTNPSTGLPAMFTTSTTATIEELFDSITLGLTALVGVNIKVVTKGKFIYIVMLDNTITNVTGYLGLSGVTNTYHIAPQADLQIIGWATLRNEVVVFTTNNSSQTPTSAGQIWKFDYDPITKVINNITASGDLSLIDHYIYNGNLNFSTHWHIGTEAIGHYENSNTGNVYFTDEYNELRSVNVLDPNLFAVSPGTFGITESVNMSLPVVEKVTAGGSIPYGATVQYCYRLFSVGGNTSTFSPVTNPIPLGTFDPSQNTSGNLFWEAHGQIGNIINSPLAQDKAITYNISNIDTNFTIIEHVAIVTTSTGAPEIYKFKEEDVPSDGNLTVIHSDKGLNIPITTQEFVFLTRTFNRCKTITVKDKRLLAANLSTADVTIDGYDSRVYRFDSSRQALVTDGELPNVTLDASITTPVWTNVPEEHDAINPYNKDTSDASPSPAITNQYKYKADGITLGGEGPNISYKFVKQLIPIKNTLSGLNAPLVLTGQPNYYLTDNVYRNVNPPISNYVSLNGQQRGHINEFQNFKSPTMAGAFTGYARGEVYRFGIVFYDLGGNPNNVKWIGDIKIPEAYDYDGNAFPPAPEDCYGVTDGKNLTGLEEAPLQGAIRGKSIGIEFNVDVSSIQENISGYEIVRVKRTESHKTRLGTGIFSNFDNLPVNRRFTYPVQSADGPSGVLDRYTIDITGTATDVLTLNDRPRINNSNVSGTGVVISPTSIMRAQTGYSWKNGDKLKTIGWYTDYYESHGKWQLINDTRVNDGSLAAVNILGKQWGPALANVSNEERVIDSETALTPGQAVDKNTTTINTTGKWILNTSPATNNAILPNRPSGIGDVKQLLTLSNPVTPTAPFWLNYSFTTNQAVITNAQDTIQWREVSYNRELSDQYGGDTFEARSRNGYISTGAFERLTEFSDPDRTYTVFGGDVTVHQFAYQYFHTDVSDLYGQYGTAIDKYHLGFSFPCEAPLNIDYQLTGAYGDKTTNDYLSNLLGDINSSTHEGPRSYVVPAFYGKQNDTKAIFYPKGFIDNFTTEHPHRIWASENKIDGELLDSWKRWLPNNFTEVEGQYGQINKITTIRDIFHYYQDTAMGAASVNDRSVINDEDGVALTLGSGGILDDFKYISRNTGTIHKFSVVNTGAAVHHFDAILKKWVRYAQGPNPISDIKGLHSTFLKLDGELLKGDRILEGVGIHGMFDKVRNKVYMTFLDAQTTTKEGVNLDYTISYNENLQSFDQFSDCTPNLWLETHGKLLTVDSSLKEGWLQYEGNKNSFFGTVYPSIISLIISTSDMTSVFDSIQYKGEIFINDIDQSNLTFDALQVTNDHQNSGAITLTPGANVIRKLRSWRTLIPRDILSPNKDARMRDYFIRLTLSHTPNSNERMVLHDIHTTFRNSSH